jgi:hypothetical protein
MVKDNLTGLVIDYKNNPTEKKLAFIFSELKVFIDKTSRRVFYSKCIKIGETTYSISDSSYELDDVKQDIQMEILRLIKNFDITKSFNTYLIASFFHYRPDFVNKEFINELVNKSLDNTEEDFDKVYDSFIVDKPIVTAFIVDDILELCTDKLDKDIIKSYAENPSIKESELADKYKVTQQYISLRLVEIRKILKKYL